MFIKLTRINGCGNEKELVVNTEEIVFVTEIEDTREVAIEGSDTDFTREKLFLIGFKNGQHPQIVDKENYDKLVAELTK